MADNKNLTFEQFVVMVQGEKILHPEWRLGQTYFNVLWQERPDISEQIRGDVQYDPFYTDGKIIAFLGFVAQAW